MCATRCGATRARTKILKISQFGLIEMDSARRVSAVAEAMSGYQDCPVSQGHGAGEDAAETMVAGGDHN